MWVFFAAGCAWALHFLLASKDVTTQDAIAHFVISREAWHRPALILNHWGRPLVTLLCMPAALFGLVYARVTSLAIAAVTVLLTVRLAQQLEVEYAFVVPALLWFQPWFPDLSVHPSLTEIPFSLTMVLSAIFFVSNKWTLVSVVTGLMPLVRHESIVLVALWAAVCALRRRWALIFLTVVPVAAYAALYDLAFGQVPGGTFPILPHPDLLGYGSHPNLLHFPKELVLGAGLPVAGLALYALPLLIRSRPRLAIVAWYGTYAAVHVVAFRLAYIAGDGSQRYMFPLAPFLAIAAAMGLGGVIGEARVSLERLFHTTARSERLIQALLAAGLAVTLAVGLSGKPVPLGAETVGAEAAVSWLRENGLADGRIVATHVYVHYFLPGHLNEFRRGGDPEAIAEWYDLSKLPPGTVAVWDSHYSGVKYGLKWKDFISDPNGGG